MPTFEKYKSSQELFDLTQELYMLEAEQELLGVNHAERIGEIREILKESGELQAQN